jgi:hypothetical protein
VQRRLQLRIKIINSIHCTKNQNKKPTQTKGIFIFSKPDPEKTRPIF